MRILRYTAPAVSTVVIGIGNWLVDVLEAQELNRSLFLSLAVFYIIIVTYALRAISIFNRVKRYDEYKSQTEALILNLQREISD